VTEEAVEDLSVSGERCVVERRPGVAANSRGEIDDGSADKKPVHAGGVSVRCSLVQVAAAGMRRAMGELSQTTDIETATRWARRYRVGGHERQKCVEINWEVLRETLFLCQRILRVSNRLPVVYTLAGLR
jgi:hypothetical protein